MAFSSSAFLRGDGLGTMDSDKPILPNDTYENAYIGDYKEEQWLRQFEGKVGDNGLRKPDSYQLNIPWIIHLTDPAVMELMGGAEKWTVYQQLFLEVEDGVIATGKGKNWRLGALRKIVDQNYANWWFNDLAGVGPFTVIVKTSTNPNTDEPNNFVSGVGKPTDNPE